MNPDCCRCGKRCESVWAEMADGRAFCDDCAPDRRGQFSLEAFR